MNRSTLRSATGSASPDSTRAPGLTDRQIGQQIRQHRLLRRLTQARVAAQIGISYQQLQRYEDGANRISMGRLSSLAKVLNVPVTRLLSEDDQPEHPLWPASPSPSRQEELLRHVAAMAPPFQQAVLRLAKALAADESGLTRHRPLGTRSPAEMDTAAAARVPGLPAGLQQGSPTGTAGGAAAAVLRGQRRTQQIPHAHDSGRSRRQGE